MFAVCAKVSKGIHLFIRQVTEIKQIFAILFNNLPFPLTVFIGNVSAIRAIYHLHNINFFLN